MSPVRTCPRFNRGPLLPSLACALAFTACVDDEAAPTTGESNAALVGQTTLDAFTSAAGNLAAAGIALPTTRETIDVATCYYDPVEPSWSDAFGGSGARYLDPLRNIYRVRTSTVTGVVTTSAAAIELRFRYDGLPPATSATGSVTPRKLTYRADGTVDEQVYSIDDDPAKGPDFVRMSLPNLVNGSAVDNLPRVGGQIIGPWADLQPKAATATAASPVAVTTVRLGNWLSWSFPCGPITMRGAVRLVRPVHVGTAKFATLPVSVIYEPNWPSGPGAYAKGLQERSRSIGSTFTTSVRREDSGQDFAVESSSVAKASKTLSTLGTVVGKAPVPGASTVSSILSTLSSIIGTDTTSVFYGADSASSATIESRFSETEDRQTNDMPSVAPAGEIGLGKRDVLCWLSNVTVGYVWVDGYLRMIPAAAEGSPCAYVFNVRAQLDLLQRRTTCALYPLLKRPSWCSRGTNELPGTIADLQAVLAMDPFAIDPTFRPEQDPARFVGCETHYEDPVYTYSWRQEDVTTATGEASNWTSRTVQQSPGLLAIIGVGPTESVNTTLRTSHGRLTTRTGMTSIGSGFRISGNGTTAVFRRCFDTAYTSVVAAPL